MCDIQAKIHLQPYLLKCSNFTNSLNGPLSKPANFQAYSLLNCHTNLCGISYLKLWPRNLFSLSYNFVYWKTPLGIYKRLFKIGKRCVKVLLYKMSGICVKWIFFIQTFFTLFLSWRVGGRGVYGCPS